MKKFLLLIIFIGASSTLFSQSSFISFGCNFFNQSSRNSITHSGGQISSNYCSYSSANITEGILSVMRPLYNINIKSNDEAQGVVMGGGSFYQTEDISISAKANYGYHFVQWNDGNIDNPRTITITQDSIFTAEFTKNIYSASTKSSNIKKGQTKGDTTTFYENNVTITAIANYGYHFAQWNDGNTDNPRTFVLLRDTSFTADFNVNKYKITVESNNNEAGVVSGTDTYDYLSCGEISATANYGYRFTKWSDGVIDNPRIITVTQDSIIQAIFSLTDTLKGQCGENLHWELITYSGKLYINGSGDMYDFETSPWNKYRNISTVKEIYISEEATSIGQNAFASCNKVSHITIPESINKVGIGAFYGCTSLKSVVWNAKDCQDFSSAPFESTINSFMFGNNVERIPAYICSGLTQLASITIPDNCSRINDKAFANCTSLRRITLGTSLRKIYSAAFEGCKDLEEIYNRRQDPSVIEDDFVFSGVDKDFCRLNIPQNCLEKYKEAFGWKDFFYTESLPFADFTITLKTERERGKVFGAGAYIANSQAIVSATPYQGYKFICWTTQSGDTISRRNPYDFEVTKDITLTARFAYISSTTQGVEVSTTETTANFECPKITGAASYYLIVWADAEQTKKVCTLSFDENGRLTNIDFAKMPQKLPAKITQEEGEESLFSFTVSGLSQGTTYNFDLNAKNNVDDVIDEKSGVFTTLKSENSHSIVIKSNNTSMGTVSSGGGWYELGDQITFSATPVNSEEYAFVCWEDGDRTNPRTITVTSDETYIAFFRKNNTAVEESLIDEEVNIFASNGKIIIKSSSEVDIAVFNVMGIEIERKNAITYHEVEVQKGIYLVRTKEKVYKVIVSR